MRDPSWPAILDEPFTVAILGRRGSGKSALGHRLLELFGDDRDAYILGFPEDKKHLLPGWVTWLPEALPYDEWPGDSVTLVNEAHHVAHARRSMSNENLDLDRLVTISRQRNADIIFDTQYARRLEVSAIMGTNAIIFRYPSLMAEDFERSQIRKLVREARDSLDQFVDVTETDEYVLRDETDELLKRAYIVGERFRGLYPHRIELPEHWTDEISHAYSDTDAADVSASGDPDPVSTSLVLPGFDIIMGVDQVDGGMARAPTQAEFDAILDAWDGFLDAQPGGDDLPVEDVIVEIDEEKAAQIKARVQSVNEKLAEASAEEANFIDKVVDLQWSKEPYLKVYTMESNKDDVHAIFAELLDAQPENLYDHSGPADREPFEYVYPWDITRSDHGKPWSPTNWTIEEFAELVDERDAGPVLIWAGVDQLE